MGLSFAASPLSAPTTSSATNLKKGEEPSNPKTGAGAGTKKEDPNKLTFTDKIRTIRSVGGEYDVFFNEHFGPYSVPYSLPLSKNKDQTPEDILKNAYQRGIPITVTVNPQTDTLLSIDSEIPREPSSSSSSSSENDLSPELEGLGDLIKKASSN